MATEEYFDVDPDELHKGGFDIVAPGYYVALVTSVVDDEKDNMIFDFLIVSAHKQREGEVGKTHREWISKNTKEGNRKKRAAIVQALGLTTAEAMKAARESSKPITVDYHKDAPGRVLCLEIASEESDDGKTRNKVPYWNYYSVNDPKHAKRFPVDHKAIAKAVDEFQHRTPEADPWDAEGRGASQPPAAHAASEPPGFDPFA